MSVGVWALRLYRTCNNARWLLASIATVILITAHASPAQAEERVWRSSNLVNPWHHLSDEKKGTIYPALHPRGAERLERTLSVYREIEKWGGWTRVPAQTELTKGSVSAGVLKLRERLLATRDLQQPSDDPMKFDDALEDAVMRFQARHGLTVTGEIDALTLDVLNIPVAEWIDKMVLNIDRLRKLGIGAVGKYVAVNIADATLEAVNNGIVEQQHRVVVGRTFRRTPLMSSKITHVDLNPNWYLPASANRWDVLPKQRRDSSYLKKNRFLVYRDNGEQRYRVNPDHVDWDDPDVYQYYRFVQLAGPKNSLGTAIIRFPNNNAIFLHDTPKKELYARAQRMHSSGCVRVEGIQDLVGWLIEGRSENWSREKLDESWHKRKMGRADLDQPIPVHLTYVTSWVDQDGVVQFRNDVYRLDKRYRRRMAALGN